MKFAELYDDITVLVARGNDMRMTGWGLVGLGVAALVPSAAIAQPTPEAILAAQLRIQGFTCSEPVTASRDPSLSKPDQEVWNVRCANQAYQMRLDPDTTARVKRLRP